MDNEHKTVSLHTLMNISTVSFVKIYSLCCEIIGQKQRGERLLEKVKENGEKQILNVNISTLKRKKRISLLDEILGVTEDGK